MVLDDEMRPFEARLNAVESWIATAEKIGDLQKEATKREAALIDARLVKIEGYHSKLFWILLTGFASSAVAFVVNGGLILGR